MYSVIQGLCIIERVKSYKYLGVLDTDLDFGMQVEYAVVKAKRTLNKICTLIKGREGLSVKVGIDLYKSLVRPTLRIRYTCMGQYQ